MLMLTLRSQADKIAAEETPPQNRARETEKHRETEKTNRDPWWFHESALEHSGVIENHWLVGWWLITQPNHFQWERCII